MIRLFFFYDILLAFSFFFDNKTDFGMKNMTSKTVWDKERPPKGEVVNTFTRVSIRTLIPNTLRLLDVRCSLPT